MKILIIGAGGNVGQVAADALESRGHEIVRASRSSENAVDVTDPESIRELFERIGAIDSVIVSFGAVSLKHLTELTREDFLAGFQSKALAQIEVARHALSYVRDNGSITLTTGVSAREPIAHAAAAAAVNGALESYVLTAAAEAPRGIRINAVSPNVLANSPQYLSLFVGQRPVTDEEVGTAYVLAVEGIINGRVLEI